MNKIIIPVLASILILGVIGLSEDAWAPTKISPTHGEPGHPFTIIDTPEGRLDAGATAVFTQDGTTFTVTLQTHNPSKTAQGNIPTDATGGTYTVNIQVPGIDDFSVGTFEVEELVCRGNADCPEDQFCNLGICEPLS